LGGGGQYLVEKRLDLKLCSEIKTFFSFCGRKMEQNGANSRRSKYPHFAEIFFLLFF
jgi:hypothetical protein